jgi:hypothetical protein
LEVLIAERILYEMLPGANTGGTSGNVFWLTLGALNPGFWLGF